MDVKDKGHKIVKIDEKYKIWLNKPNNFIYSIKDIIIEYDSTLNQVNILGDEIPPNIKANMKQYYQGNIKSYIKSVEENLMIFFRGQIPSETKNVELVNETESTTIKSDISKTTTKVDVSKESIETVKTLRPHELPNDYSFPIINNLTHNVMYDVERVNIAVSMCKSLNIVVECDRCKTIYEISESSVCTKCRQNFHFVFVPSLHMDSLGFMTLSGCRLVCFNPSRWQFSCDKCDNNYETLPLGLGDSFVLNCYNCSTKLQLKVINIRFIAPSRQIPLKEGQPLPDKGACKHYKRSFRWFRFPCCHALYPCDICHDANSDHQAVAANKMVCGLCSREQSCKKDCLCGMSIDKKTTAFWEGGKGLRDKAAMSKKDGKKYKK